jgi:hypothetical protein
MNVSYVVQNMVKQIMKYYMNINLTEKLLIIHYYNYQMYIIVIVKIIMHITDAYII